jgi:hypothetical protein
VRARSHFINRFGKGTASELRKNRSSRWVWEGHEFTQDYLLDEGSSSSYPFTHEALCDYVFPEEELTIGIGVIAEHGDMVVMGTDMRATYPKLPTAHEGCAKAWLMPKPIQCGVSVAGKLTVGQTFVDFLAFYLEKAAKENPIYRDHVEIAIDKARFRTWRRLIDWDMKTTFGMSLDEWKSGKVVGTGKLDSRLFEGGKLLMRATDLEVEALVAGYVNEQLLFYKASRKRPLESTATPGVQVIGTGGVLAMNHLNRREQTMACSFARSVLHVAEALEEARKEPNGTVGKPAWIFAITKKGEAAYIKPDHPTLTGWKKAYKNRNDTTSLQNCKLSEIQAKGMTKPLDVQK